MSTKQNPTSPFPPSSSNSEDSSSYDDERVVRSGGAESRGHRGIEEDAERRDSGAMLSEREYLARVQAEFEQISLPKPPPIPGWHTCWLTTMSTSDSIQKRLRLGYELVKTGELPGFDPSNGQGLAQYSGYITCNEMVLGKIPDAYFQRMMRYFHHDQPNEEQETTLTKIKNGLDKEKDSEGRDLGAMLGDGYLDMDKTAKHSSRTPRFPS